ncbi:hypothetical protein ACQYRI_12560 [Salmonella enterica]
MELKNVQRYYPQNMPYGSYVQYFTSEDGLDFYESFKLFTKKYKVCVTFDEGVVCAISRDISTLYPGGYTVVEVDEFPEGSLEEDGDGAKIIGFWRYSNNTIEKITNSK